MVNKFISNLLLVIFYTISSLNCLQLFADPNWKKWLFVWMFLSFFLVILGFISIISKYKLKYWIMFFVFLFSCFLIYFKTWWTWDKYFILNLLFWLSFLTQIFWISLEKKNETIEKQNKTKKLLIYHVVVFITLIAWHVSMFIDGYTDLGIVIMFISAFFLIILINFLLNLFLKEKQFRKLRLVLLTIAAIFLISISILLFHIMRTTDWIWAWIMMGLILSYLLPLYVIFSISYFKEYLKHL